MHMYISCGNKSGSKSTKSDTRATPKIKRGIVFQLKIQSFLIALQYKISKATNSHESCADIKNKSVPENRTSYVLYSLKKY